MVTTIWGLPAPGWYMIDALCPLPSLCALGEENIAQLQKEHLEDRGGGGGGAQPRILGHD